MWPETCWAKSYVARILKLLYTIAYNLSYWNGYYMHQSCTPLKPARAIFLQLKQLRAAGLDSRGGYFINNYLIKNKQSFNYVSWKNEK
jgi:hypothetical protein